VGGEKGWTRGHLARKKVVEANTPKALRGGEGSMKAKAHGEHRSQPRWGVLTWDLSASAENTGPTQKGRDEDETEEATGQYSGKKLRKWGGKTDRIKMQHPRFS